MFIFIYKTKREYIYIYKYICVNFLLVFEGGLGESKLKIGTLGLPGRREGKREKKKREIKKRE